jgi:hypothetical protein
MKSIYYIIGAGIMVVAVVGGLSLLFVLPVYLLWNWLVPIIFIGGGIAPHITLWQAWGILLLCGALFKSSRLPDKK